MFPSPPLMLRALTKGYLLLVSLSSLYFSSSPLQSYLHIDIKSTYTSVGLYVCVCFEFVSEWKTSRNDCCGWILNPFFRTFMLLQASNLKTRVFLDFMLQKSLLACCTSHTIIYRGGNLIFDSISINQQQQKSRT